MKKDRPSYPPDSRSMAGQLLLFIADDVIDAINKALKPFGISEGRFGLLLVFMSGRTEENTMQPSELADKVGVTRATITKQLNILEQCGIIEKRVNSSDQRMVDIAITEKGHRLLHDALPEYWKACAEMVSPLSSEEVSELIRIIEKFKPELR